MQYLAFQVLWRYKVSRAPLSLLLGSLDTEVGCWLVRSVRLKSVPRHTQPSGIPPTRLFIVFSALGFDGEVLWSNVVNIRQETGVRLTADNDKLL